MEWRGPVYICCVINYPKQPQFSLQFCLTICAVPRWAYSCLQLAASLAWGLLALHSGHILQWSRRGMYTCIRKVPEEYKLPCASTSQAPACIMSVCNPLPSAVTWVNPEWKGAQELHRRGLGPGNRKGRNGSYFCSHPRASVCIASVQMRRNSFIQVILAYTTFLKYAMWHILTCVYTCEAITTIKVVNPKPFFSCAFIILIISRQPMNKQGSCPGEFWGH